MSDSSKTISFRTLSSTVRFKLIVVVEERTVNDYIDDQEQQAVLMDTDVLEKEDEGERE